ncbi:MAG: amidohydrolase family protein [Myxococcales bacterium]|nr:amidohydrolase family protein [Myxococcales bacterium]MCB9749721.1 amidohydrolase family protein [Myxococcales bacterium]
MSLSIAGCGAAPTSSTRAPSESDASASGEASASSESDSSSSAATSAATASSSGSEDTSGAETTSATTDGRRVLVGGRVAGGGRLDLELEDGFITAVGVFDGATLEGAEVIDVTGKWLCPAFIDSHVHLAYLPVASSLAARGVAAAVDLAAPLPFLERLPTRPRVLASGPMVTAVAGYPTLGWGANGYGIECADATAAVAAVDLVVSAGAAVVKLPITNPPTLDPVALAAATARAHEHGLKVVTHALEDKHVQLARAAGVDVLGHTPVLPLEPATATGWGGRAVVTTLAAFGASQATLDNLGALRDAGATILYGTDLGNSQDAGIQAAELAAMMTAGLDGAAILAAGTLTPASYWGLDTLGSLEVGKAASVLVLDEDPVSAPMTLSAPAMVFMDGELLP